jgi:hypothetical protein
MRQVKILAVSAMAILSLSALIVSTASAIPAPSVLPAEAVTFTATGGKGTLATLSGTTVECKKQTSEGSLAAGVLLGPVHIMFSECSSSLGSTCTGLGETSGTILVLGEFHIVALELGTVLDPALLILVNSVHFSCSIILVETKGEVVCKTNNGNVKTKTYTLKCEQTSAGDPAVTSYFNEKGEEVRLGENGFLTSVNHAAFEMTSLATEATLTTSKEIELMV